MNIFKRSFLYVSRNISRTLLLFFILLIVASFVLSGLSIMNASENTSAELRGTTGASFRIERNLATGGSSDQGGGLSYNTQEYVTDKMIEDINKIEGIKAYTAQSISRLSLCDTAGKRMEAIKYTTKWDDVELNYIYNDIGSFYSEYNEKFLSNQFELTEGKHITPDDKEVIVISEDLAKKHNLKLGDKASLYRDSWTSGTIDAGDESREVEIIGIFKIIEKQENKESTVSYDLYENQIFVDMKTNKELSDWVPYDLERDGYESADFYVDDPAQIEAIIQNVQKIKNINWNNFNISVNDEVYQRSASSMSNVGTLLKTLIVVVTVISSGIIILILSMWLKGRMHETGILLAIGVTKTELLIQHMIETLLIAIPSFVAAWFLSNAIAGKLGTLFDVSSEITISKSHFIAVCVSGGIILLAAVLISCIQIIRTKPKEILSKMS